ncbi:MAG: hypothetical protein Q9197_006226 [Variospora fuerteventurae]
MNPASTTEDLEHLTSVPPSKALEVAKQLILDILYDQQASAVKCARRIEHIWTFVGNLTDDDLTTTKIQAWRDDVETTVGKDELQRQLTLSRSESALEGYRRRIRTAWNVEAEEFLEPQYYDPHKQLSYGLLKSLAESAARVPLDQARRHVVAAIQERIRDTTTPRLSKAPFLVPHDLKRLKEGGNNGDEPGSAKQLLVWQDDQPETTPSAGTRSKEQQSPRSDTATATLSRKKRKTRDGTYRLRGKRTAIPDPASIEPNKNSTTTANHLPESPRSSAVGNTSEANHQSRRTHRKLVHTTFDRFPLGTLQQQPVERARSAATPQLDDFEGYENENPGFASDDDDAYLSPLHGVPHTPSTAGSFHDIGDPQTIEEEEEVTMAMIGGEDPLPVNEVACFAPGEWIVGSVIDRCVSLVSACGFPGVQVWSNTVLDRPTGTRLRLSTSTERVLIPCQNSNHWVIGQYDLKARTIALYDPLPDGDDTEAAFTSIKSARLRHRSHLNLLQKRLDSVKSGLSVLDSLQRQCIVQLRHADDPEPARKEVEDLINFETRLASMIKTETDLSGPVKAKIREVRRIVELCESRRKYLDDYRRGFECAIQTAESSGEEARSTIEAIRKEDTNLGAWLRTEADKLEAQAGSVRSVE